MTEEIRGMSTRVAMETEDTGMVVAGGETIAVVFVNTETRVMNPNMMRSIRVLMSMVTAGAMIKGSRLTDIPMMTGQVIKISTAVETRTSITGADTDVHCRTLDIKPDSGCFVCCYLRLVLFSLHA